MKENQRKKNSEYVAAYAKKRETKSIKFDMYLADPVEKHMFETWQKEPNKKQLFIKIYSEYLAKKTAE